MYNKLTQSQSTLVSTRDNRLNFYNSRDEQTMLKNPYSHMLPLKFPKNTIRKQTSQTMLTQTMLLFINSGKIQSRLVCVFITRPIAADSSRTCRCLLLKRRNYRGIQSICSIHTINANCPTLGYALILPGNP